MKKLIIILVVTLSFSLMSCDFFNTLTTSELSTTQSITTGLNPSTTTETIITESKTTEIISIINDNIYLKLNSGQDTVEINSEWIDSGAKFVFNDEEFDMTTTDTVDETTLGLYQVSYTYTYQEIEYEIVRYVIVVDQTKPVIELNLGVDTIKVGNNWTDAGVTITDNSEETIIAVFEGTVDTNAPGTYEITYIATDSSGNESSVTRYVTVIE